MCKLNNDQLVSGHHLGRYSVVSFARNFPSCSYMLRKILPLFDFDLVDGKEEGKEF